MPPNGGRITARDVYEIVGEYRKEVNACLSELRTQNMAQGEAIAVLNQCTGEHTRRLDALSGENGTIAMLDTKVDELRAGEGRWRAITSLLAVISGAVSGLLAGRQ